VLTNLCASLTSSYARRDTTPQIDTVNNEIADYRSRTSAALNANTDISVLMQERLAERHRRLADIDAQIELLKQATKASGEKQQELAALRRENDGLQAVVDLVMGTLQAEGDLFDVEDDADGGGAGAASASE
jgi:arginine utilization protein RocB